MLPTFTSSAAGVSFVILSLLSSGTFAGEPPAVVGDDVHQRIVDWDAEIAGIDADRKRIADEILALRRVATDADRDWQKVDGQRERLESRKRDLLKSIQDNRAAIEKAEQEAKEAEASAEQSTKDDKAEQGDAEREKRLAEARQAIVDAEAEVGKIDGELPALAPLVAAAKDHAEMLHVQIRAAEHRHQELLQRQQEVRRSVESTLKEARLWVSFQDQIAPIFQTRCVACHNVRNPQGRYNMANFDAILGQGESGQAVVPGDAEHSLLVEMIRDGSMPLDSDPLSEEEVQLISRWVEWGARIEVDADRRAPLIRMLPHPVHPLAPETYPATIPVTALATSADGSLIASSGYHEVLLWSLDEQGSATLQSRISNVAQRVHGLALHPTETWLAVASGTPGQFGEIKLMDVRDGQVIADLLVSEDEMFDVAFSPDGSRIAACGADGSIAIFERSEAGNWRSRIIADHADWVHSIRWSPDGSLLVTASRDKTAKVFAADSGKLLVTFNGHGQNVGGAVFLADGKRVASAGDDRKVRVWSVDDGKQQRDIQAARSEIAGIAVDEHDRVITFGGDASVRVHGVGDGKQVQKWDLPTPWVSSLAISPRRQTVFVGDHAGRIHAVPMEATSSGETAWTAAPR